MVLQRKLFLRPDKEIDAQQAKRVRGGAGGGEAGEANLSVHPNIFGGRPGEIEGPGA